MVKGDQPREKVFTRLNREAEMIPPGSEGVVVLDHWQGNRTPWSDPTSRGVIRGLSLIHTPAHIYRAIMEGVAYGTAVILRTMEDAGISIDEIIACGGASRSDLWLGIHANVTGRPITVTEEPDASALGAGILASVAAGMYGSIEVAASQMVKTKRVIDPEREIMEQYRHHIDTYEETYHALKHKRKN